MPTDWREVHRQIAERKLPASDVLPLRAILSPEEFRLLREWGSWLEALWSGVLAPQTEMQRQFVEAVSDRIPTRTSAEYVWRTYLLHHGLSRFAQPVMLISSWDESDVQYPEGAEREYRMRKLEESLKDDGLIQDDGDRELDVDVDRVLMDDWPYPDDDGEEVVGGSGGDDDDDEHDEPEYSQDEDEEDKDDF